MQASQLQNSFLHSNSHLSIEISSKQNEFDSVKINDLEDFLYDPTLTWKSLLETFNVNLPHPDQYAISSGSYIGSLNLMVQDCDLILNANTGKETTIKFVIDYKTLSKKELAKASDEVQRYNFRDPAKSRKRYDSDLDYEESDKRKGTDKSTPESQKKRTSELLRNKRRPGPKSKMDSPRRSSPGLTLSASKLKEMEKELFGEIRSIFRTSSSQATAAAGRAPPLTNEEKKEEQSGKSPSPSVSNTRPRSIGTSHAGPSRSSLSKSSQPVSKISLSLPTLNVPSTSRTVLNVSSQNLEKKGSKFTNQEINTATSVGKHIGELSGSGCKLYELASRYSTDNSNLTHGENLNETRPSDSQLTEKTDLNRSQSLFENAPLLSPRIPSPKNIFEDDTTEEEEEKDIKPNVDLLALCLKKELLKQDDKTPTESPAEVSQPTSPEPQRINIRIPGRGVKRPLALHSDEESDLPANALTTNVIPPSTKLIDGSLNIPLIAHPSVSVHMNGNGINTPPLSERSRSSSGGGGNRTIAIQLTQNPSSSESQDRLLNKHARKFVKACDAASGRCEKIKNEVRNFRKKSRDETGWKPWAKFHDNCPTLAEVLRQMYDSSDSESE